MKKLFLMLALASLTLAASAATSVETPSKYSVATNSFWSNWYFQFGLDMTVENPVGASLITKEAWHEGRSYGIDVAAGKWFTPGYGVRFKLNWEPDVQMLNFYRCVDCVAYPCGDASGIDGDGYVAFYYDNLWNLSNLFCGYSDTRVWNVSLFPRLGVLYNVATEKVAPVIGAGIESTWKISKRCNIYADLAYQFTSSAYNGALAAGNLVNNENAYCSLDLGVTVNVGTVGFKKAVTLDAYNALAAESEAALAKLRGELERERQINADLRAQLAKKPAEKPAEIKTVIHSAATSVFFNINSSKINSKKDIINLESIATTAKNSGAKVVITGSADSKTGSAAYNEKLSAARAEAVKAELVNLGVSESKIEVKSVGGVNDMSPINLNRRAVVELK